MGHRPSRSSGRVWDQRRLGWSRTFHISQWIHFPGLSPSPAKTPRREMLRAAASPLGKGMTNARAGAAIAACSAPGVRVLPSDYTPHQITVWERVFPCGGKKKIKSAWSLWPVLQLSGAPARAEAPGDPGAKPRPWGSTCRNRQQGIKHTDPTRLDQTPH